MRFLIQSKHHSSVPCVAFAYKNHQHTQHDCNIK